MVGSQNRINHATLTKRSFLFGLGLFVLSELAEPLQRLVGFGIPGWEHSLLGVGAGIGVLVALLSPFVFGIVLPLVE